MPISDILGALTSIMNFETQESRELGDVTPYNENFRLGLPLHHFWLDNFEMVENVL